MKTYRDLEIYQESYHHAIKVHTLSLKLPTYELYEQGSQVRRSSKSIKSNIVEGYGGIRYKLEYVRFLIFAHASCDETISHLKMISDLHFPRTPLTDLIEQYENLSRKINRFIQYIENN